MGRSRGACLFDRRPVDRYGPPDVVFIDVDGFEEEALAGAARTIEAGPDWFVEVHPVDLARYDAEPGEVLAHFDPRATRSTERPIGLSQHPGWPWSRLRASLRSRNVRRACSRSASSWIARSVRALRR